MLFDSFFSVTLRGMTLASKFVLLFFMARYMSPEEVGTYGIIAATISLSLFILGFDFYVFNTRELLAAEQVHIPRLIRDQLVFHVVVYAVTLPALVLVFGLGYIKWTFVGWFYALLILEHLSQESYRILVTLSRPIAANWILFLRSGSWGYAVVALAMLSEEERNLTTVMVGWILGALTSLLFTAYFLRDLCWRKAFSVFVPVNWTWIRRGARISLIFFGATLGLKVVEYFDRFFIQHYSGDAMVGVYTFYSSIANVVQTFVATGVTAILGPKIISAYQASNHALYRELLHKFAKNAVIGAVILSLVAAAAFYPVLHIVQKPIYGIYVLAYWLLLLAAIMAVVASIPSYVLYAQRRDRAILVSAVSAACISVGLNYVLVPVYGVVGAAASALVSMTIFGAVSYSFAVKVTIPFRFR